MTVYWIICNGVIRGRYSKHGYKRIIPYDNLNDARADLIMTMMAENVRHGIISKSKRETGIHGTITFKNNKYLWTDKKGKTSIVGITGRLREQTNEAGIPIEALKL